MTNTNNSLSYKVRYGLLDGSELLHLHKCTDDTYLLAKPVAGLPSLNEWTTDNPMTVVYMLLCPEDYPGLYDVFPRLLNMSAIPVTVHTSHCEDGSVHKTYVPIRVPEKLSYLDLAYKNAITIHNGDTTRYLYSTPEICRVDPYKVYYYPFTDASVDKFFKCIGAVESEYLLLELTRNEVIDILSFNGRAM
jgi:hypothetical protein